MKVTKMASHKMKSRAFRSHSIPTAEPRVLMALTTPRWTYGLDKEQLRTDGMCRQLYRCCKTIIPISPVERRKGDPQEVSSRRANVSRASMGPTISGLAPTLEPKKRAEFP